MADEPTTETTETPNSTTTETPTTTDAAPANTDDGVDTSLIGGATGEEGKEPKEGEPKEGEPAKEGDTGDDEGVPESYTIAADALPEGAEIDTKLLEDAAPTFKELGLSNKAANKLAPLALKVAERMAERQADNFAATRKAWADETLADPELGGKNWKATEANVARALDHFVGPQVGKGADGKEYPNEFRQLLNETGLGSHPVMVRAFKAIGEAMSEDTNFVRGDNGAAIKVPRENILYPEDAPKT